MKTVLKLGTIPFILSMALSSSLLAQEPKADSINGSEVWAATCTRCHNLREPADLSKRAWRYSMQHMRVRAGLTGKETRDILAFILEAKSNQDNQ